MKKLCLLAIAFALVATVMAQPGYMGKKISLGLNYGTYPYFTKNTAVIEMSGFSTTFDTESDKTFKWNNGLHLTAGIVLSRKVEFLLGGTFAKNIYYNRKFTLYEDMDDPDFDDGFVRFIPDDPEFQARTLGGLIGCRHYFGAYVAPIGVYHHVTGELLSYRFVEDKLPGKAYETEYDGGVQPKTRYDLDVSGSKAQAFRISYGLGVKSVITGNIFFNFESNFHFYLNDWGRASNDFFPDSGYKQSGEAYGTDVLQINAFSYKRIDLRFGLGVML